MLGGGRRYQLYFTTEPCHVESDGCVDLLVGNVRIVKQSCREEILAEYHANNRNGPNFDCLFPCRV